MENQIVIKSKNGNAITTSLLVASKFGKRHVDVLDAIRNLTKVENSTFVDNELDTELSDKLNTMFYFTTKKTKMPIGDGFKETPIAVMTRDGFSLLVMGFTGKDAIKFKLEFIEAFNKMERIINEQSQPKMLSQSEIILAIAQQNVENERRQLALEASHKELELKFKEFKEEFDANAKEIELSPESTVELADKTMRSTLSSFVNAVSKAKGIPFNNIWNSIYSEFKTRYHINVQVRANNAGVSKIQWCDDNHYLDVVYGIAKQLYGKK